MKISIPPDWTAQEARTIYEFLESINREIFRVYKESIEELCWTECWNEVKEQESQDDSDFNDEIPF